MDDRLVCQRCASTYRIRRGIPRFADSGTADLPGNAATRESFGHEFTRVDPPVQPARKRLEDVVTFFRATVLGERIYHHVRNSENRQDLTPDKISYRPDGSSLHGRLVLDAGCGGGRFSALAAGYGAHVVGLDRSDAVERAAEVTAGLDVDIVQG